MQKEKFTIVGGGLVGALQAVSLAQKGYPVQVFERRPDVRKTNIYQGRSINLALSNRGWRALKNVGIADNIMEIAIPMHKRTMHDLQGNLTHQPYGRENEAIYSVSRGDLNRRLIELADAYPETEFHFNMRCTDFDPEKQTLSFYNEETKSTELHSYEYLLGTDGAFSAIRHRLMFNDRFNYSQHYIEHGYKEFAIEPDANGNHRMDKNSLHIWPRGEFMLIALPNTDGSFTCTLFFPFEGTLSFNSIKTERDVLRFFEYYFPDFLQFAPNITEQYFQNPTSSLVMVKCYPWHYGNNVLLMGDAAHAIVPFFGQGMNAGFEDCTIFMKMLEENNGGLEGLFPAFGKLRKPDADAIADLALQNFVEMRDLTANPEFLLRKKIEARFSEAHPELWTTLYSMVTFREFPYSEALREGQRQDRIMAQVMAVPDIEKKWVSPEIDRLMLELVQNENI